MALAADTRGRGSACAESVSTPPASEGRSIRPRRGGDVKRTVLERCVESPQGELELALSGYGPHGPHESFRTADRWPEYSGLHVGAGGEIPLGHVPSQSFVSGPRQGTTAGPHADLMFWCAEAPLDVRYAGLVIP